MLIDTHSHINFAHFDSNRDDVVKRFSQVWGTVMFLVGCDFDTSKRAVEISEAYNNRFDEFGVKFYAVIGIHPTSASEMNDQFYKWASEILRSGRAVGVGETGIDLYHDSERLDVQTQSLKRHISLALEFDVPIIIHSREVGMVASKIDLQNSISLGTVGLAGKTNLETLKVAGVKKAIFHCFSYDLEFAKQVWEAEYLTSFSGILTYTKNDYLREVAKFAPNDRFVVETDCPYLPPQSKRGQENEPAFVKETVDEISRIRGEEASEFTAKNALRLFGIN